MWKSKFGWWKKFKKSEIPSKHYINCSNAITQMQMPMPMPLHTPHLAFHVLADIGPANGCNSSGVPRASVGPANSHCNLAQRWPSQRPSQWPSQEPALAQPTATLSMVREIFLNGSFVSTQFRDAGDLEHPQHVTLALLFYTRHFMLLCNWAVIGEILLVYRNLSWFTDHHYYNMSSDKVLGCVVNVTPGRCLDQDAASCSVSVCW